MLVVAVIMLTVIMTPVLARRLVRAGGRRVVCVCARVRARACVFVRACLVYLYHTASVYSLHVPEADIRA